MKTSNKQTSILAIFTLVVGVALGASGVLGLIEVSREHPAVSRFLLGYTLLWSGITILIQQSQKRALVTAHAAALQIASKRREKFP